MLPSPPFGNRRWPRLRRWWSGIGWREVSWFYVFVALSVGITTILSALRGEGQPGRDWIGFAIGLPALFVGLVMLVVKIRTIGEPSRGIARGGGPPHRVEVMEVESEEIPRYYVATCECGWLSDIQDTEGPVREQAHRHTPNVESNLLRPLAEETDDG